MSAGPGGAPSGGRSGGPGGADAGAHGGAGVVADWTALRTARDVEGVLRALFGAPPGHGPGVVHVSAVAAGAVARGPQRPGAAAEEAPPPVVIRSAAAGAPRSLLDRFLLLAARARAEAILTTGRILRDEPELRHALSDHRDHPAASALADWRREVAGLSEEPRLLILTASGEIDPDHPALALAPPPRPAVFTSAAGAERLAARMRGRDVDLGIEVVVDSAPDPRRAIAWLQERARRPRITVECGPAAAAPLYAPPPLVEELWLSTFRGPLPEDARGPAFLDPSRIEAALPHVSQPFVLTEPSGTWQVERRRARASPAGSDASRGGLARGAC